MFMKRIFFDHQNKTISFVVSHWIELSYSLFELDLEMLEWRYDSQSLSMKLFQKRSTVNRSKYDIQDTCQPVIPASSNKIKWNPFSFSEWVICSPIKSISYLYTHGRTWIICCWSSINTSNNKGFWLIVNSLIIQFCCDIVSLMQMKALSKSYRRNFEDSEHNCSF